MTDEFTRSYQSLPEIANNGNRLETLKEMRRIVARALEGAEDRNIASLSKEMREILDEIYALSSQTNEDSNVTSILKEYDAWNKTA